MFRHYFTTAIRNLRNSKSASVIGIVGLAMGMACYIAAVGVITYLTSNDRHLRDADQLYVVAQRIKVAQMKFDTGYRVASSWVVQEHMRVDMPNLRTARARNVRDLAVSANGRSSFLKVSAASPTFPELISLPLAYSVNSNPLAVSRGVILSEQAAISLFGTTAVLGRALSLQNAFDVTIAGVLRPIPQPSHIGPTSAHALSFDLLMTETTFDAFESAVSGTAPPPRVEATSWGGTDGLTYVSLPADGSITAGELQDYLSQFTARYKPANLTQMDFAFKATALSDVRLATLDGELFRGSNLSLTGVLLFAAFLVLAVASLNYANLSVAESLVRARELGLRRVLGASQAQIFAQYLVENALRLAIATAIAALLVMGLLAGSSIDFDATISTVVANGWFWISLAFATVGLNAVLSAYCGFALVRSSPVRSLKDPTQHKGGGLGLRLSLCVQFTVAALFLIGVAVSQQQNALLRKTAVHADEDPVVMIEIPWQSTKVTYESIKQELLGHSSIKSVSTYSAKPWSKSGGITTFNRTPTSALTSTIITSVRHDFEHALSMKLLAGRSFDEAFGDREWPLRPIVTSAFEHRAVVDRSFARSMGWYDPRMAVGQQIFQPDSVTSAPNPVTIIGVIEDKPLRMEGLQQTFGNFYVLAPVVNSRVIARIDRERIPEALAEIDRIWKQFVPLAPVKRRFFDEFFEQEFQTFLRVNQALTLVAIVGIAISAMGLFGIALFVARRRSREIGIRKTLGARVGQIVVMLLRDFSKPIVIANAIAWPIAYLATQEYLNRFIERTTVTAWPFILSLVLTLGVAWLAVGGHAFRAARGRPVDVLRYE